MRLLVQIPAVKCLASKRRLALISHYFKVVIITFYMLRHGALSLVAAACWETRFVWNTNASRSFDVWYDTIPRQDLCHFKAPGWAQQVGLWHKGENLSRDLAADERGILPPPNLSVWSSCVCLRHRVCVNSLSRYNIYLHI